MKSAASKLSAVLISGVALLLAGCPKKPVRPSPDSTLIGQTGANTGGASGLTSTDLNGNQGLTTRDADADANGQVRGKMGDPVFFAFDHSDIAPAERTKLQAAAKTLNEQYAQYRLLLEGHCDWHGTAEYNLALGDRRASAVKKYLASIGVGPDKMDTLSKGSEEAAKNADAETRKHDRRVDLVLLVPGAAPVAPAGGMAPAPAGGAPDSSTPPPPPAQ